MSSTNGAPPRPAPPPKAKKPLEVRCWVMMIITGYGDPIPVWVPCQMPVTGPLRTVS